VGSLDLAEPWRVTAADLRQAAKVLADQAA